MEEFMQKVGAFFTTPDLRKCAPGYAVSGCNLTNITLPDMVTVITLIYTIVLLVGAIPGIWKTWDFFKARRAKKKDEEEEK